MVLQDHESRSDVTFLVQTFWTHPHSWFTSLKCMMQDPLSVYSTLKAPTSQLLPHRCRRSPLLSMSVGIMNDTSAVIIIVAFAGTLPKRKKQRTEKEYAENKQI